MFPIRPESNTLPSDKIIDLEIIKSDFPTVEIDMTFPLIIWSDGINTLPEIKFIKLAEEFIANCKELKKEKIYIVSQDGTITSYHQMISCQSLTRKDFPQETGWFQIRC